MATEKATALVLRTTDFRETSRVVSLWTREFGKVHALAKGGRRLRSQFESALDLLNCCDIVLIRKTSPSLDLLVEARLRQRFGSLHQRLEHFYAGCLIAEILDACAQENDPHPQWFDATLDALQQLQQSSVWQVLLRWEIIALREAGFQPMLDNCVVCKKPIQELAASQPITWNALAGGVICGGCAGPARGRRPLTGELLHAWQQASHNPQRTLPDSICRQLLEVLHEYWMHQLARPLRLAEYFSSSAK